MALVMLLIPSSLFLERSWVATQQLDLRIEGLPPASFARRTVLIDAWLVLLRDQSRASQLASRTESQASTLEETAASMEKLRTALAASSGGAGLTAELAARASEAPGVGGNSHAGHEQSLCISQLGETVVELDPIARQDVALVVQSAAAAESPRRQAQTLNEAVAAFRA